MASKVDGTAGFGIDVRVPGMLFAVIARCPHFGGKLSNFDAAAAKAVPGVLAVFPVPPLGFLPKLGRNVNVAGGIAVVANSTWAAIQGRRALKLSWDKGPGANENTDNLSKRLREQATAPPTFVAVNQGDALQALDKSGKRIDAFYELPFQAHATMEPMNTTVHVRDDGIEVWSPTQTAPATHAEIAELSGVPVDKVNVHMTLSGGSFGRRYQWDFPDGSMAGRKRDEASSTTAVDPRRRHAARFLPAICLSSPVGRSGPARQYRRLVSQGGFNSHSRGLRFRRRVERSQACRAE